MSLANNKQVLLWNKDDKSRIWELPITEKTNHFSCEIKQSIESESYINTAGDLIFLTHEQIQNCKEKYNSFEECNNTNTLDCKVKQQWWSFQKFIGALTTIEDCII